MEADDSTYRLWKRFSMPIGNGTRDAVSVSSEDGKRLLSAYTLMMELMILQLWALLVLAGISAFMRKAHSPNIGAASAAIWNSQGSAFTVLKLMAQYFFRMKRKRDRWYAVLWMCAAATLLAVGYVVSINVPRFLILGNGAPVDPTSIFVPSNKNLDNSALYASFALRVPSSLRAAGSVNATGLPQVTLSSPVVTSGVTGSVQQIHYSYTISAADFGLQHAAGLNLNVEGSCITEYTWLAASRSINGTWIDTYHLYGLKENTIDISLFDGRPPTAYFSLGSLQERSSNTSFAITISSAKRLSFTPGSDPLYATESTNDTAENPGYIVRTGRPILSCWENDVWSYKGHTGNVFELSSLPGLNMPDELRQYFFERFLGLPMIVSLGINLGAQALQSSATSLGLVFDARSSNMETDLRKLVAAAYIASINIFADTTTFKSNTANITNLAIDPNTKSIYPGVADFIVKSINIATLSVKVIIVIPVVLVLVTLIVAILTNSPASWNKAQALNSTILYSCLDERSEAHGAGTWNRTSQVAYCHGDVEKEAALWPEFGKEAGLHWSRRLHGE